MKYLVLWASFFIIQSLSAQTTSRPVEDDIFKVADSIVSNGFSGVIVINTPHGNNEIFNAGIANEEIGKPIKGNSLFNLLSLGKSLTAAIIIKLAQEGKLELDDTVEKFLPARSIPNQNKITIRQLLSHSSGLGDYMAAEDYKTLPRSKVSLDTLLSIVENQPVKGIPGESFIYSNSGYIVLGAIIEAIEKEPYKKVLMEKVLKPAGIEEVYFSEDNRGVKYYVKESEEPVNQDFPPASSDGGIWMSAIDMSKFLSFLFSEELTEESRNLLFQRIIEFPNRGEIKNAGLAASFIVYEYPKGVKVIENNGGYKGSTYSTFRIMYNEKGEKIIATVLSNKEDTAGSAMKALQAEIKKALQ